MNVRITPRIIRNKTKTFYSLEWGKKAGQRLATGIFTYTNPQGIVERNHNKQALQFLNIKRLQLIAEWQSIGAGIIPTHKYQSNFLDFYKAYVSQNRQVANRHLECSFTQFKLYIRKQYLSPIDVTKDLCLGFRKYLLDSFNGDTPSNYFSRYKRVVKSATLQRYFVVNPCQDISSKANKNKRRKNHLEAEEYIKLLNTPILTRDVREAFIFCCYTGLRWCDIKSLSFGQINKDSIIQTIIQNKTSVEQHISLHPIAQLILGKRIERLGNQNPEIRLFNLPTAEGANKVLSNWCGNAGVDKHITWNCARLSFSILLQDANVDAATVALLLGHNSTKYVNETYKRYRPKDQVEAILKLPSIPFF